MVTFPIMLLTHNYVQSAVQFSKQLSFHGCGPLFPAMSYFSERVNIVQLTNNTAQRTRGARQ